MDNLQKRKKGKDKSKNTFNKYGKYTTKSLRIQITIAENSKGKKSKFDSSQRQKNEHSFNN